MVDFGKVLCSSAYELQQNSNASSREDYVIIVFHTPNHYLIIPRDALSSVTTSVVTYMIFVYPNLRAGLKNLSVRSRYSP